MISTVKIVVPYYLRYKFDAFLCLNIYKLNFKRNDFFGIYLKIEKMWIQAKEIFKF